MDNEVSQIHQTQGLNYIPLELKLAKILLL